MITNNLLTINTLKRAMATVLCAATLTITLASPGFAASRLDGEIQGQVTEFYPSTPGCPDCIGNGVKPVDKILPDTIMESRDKILPDSIMDPVDKIIPDTIMESKDWLAQ